MTAYFVFETPIVSDVNEIVGEICECAAEAWDEWDEYIAKQKHKAIAEEAEQIMEDIKELWDEWDKAFQDKDDQTADDIMKQINVLQKKFNDLLGL